MPLDRSSLPLSENPIINPIKGINQSKDAFEDAAFKPEFEIVKS